MTFKKFLTLIMSLILIICTFSSCNGSQPSSTDSSDTSPVTAESMNDEDFNIVTSFYPIYILTANITKDIPNVKVTCLTQPKSGCLHDYQFMPEDLKVLEKADVFVINGAGMEAFLENITAQLPNLKIIDSSEDIPLLRNDYSNFNFATIEQGNEETDPTQLNPHIWLSVSNAITQVSNISRGLIMADNKNAVGYSNNSAAYLTKLTELDASLKKQLAPYKGHNIITFHESFPYFAKEYGLKLSAVIEQDENSEPTAQQIAKMIDMIKKTKINGLFTDAANVPPSAQSISKETGITLYQLDSVTTGELNNLDAYTEKMENNAKVLIEAFTQ